MAANGTRTAGGSTGTVTVACKHPHGYICRVFRMEEFPEPVMGGGTRLTKKARESGRFVLNGNAVAVGEAPRVEIVGGIDAVPGIPGYALTHGVPADLWEAWAEQNKDHPAVVNKLVFAHASAASAIDQAKDGAKLRSGLEPMLRDEIDKNGNIITRDPRTDDAVLQADEMRKRRAA